MNEVSTMHRADLISRIIGRRYWFSGPLGSLSPVAVVAVRSKVGESWAAFIAGVEPFAREDDDMAINVADLGAKLDEATARAMFPDVEAEYRA